MSKSLGEKSNLLNQALQRGQVRTRGLQDLLGVRGLGLRDGAADGVHLGVSKSGAPRKTPKIRALTIRAPTTKGLLIFGNCHLSLD